MLVKLSLFKTNVSYFLNLHVVEEKKIDVKNERIFIFIKRTLVKHSCYSNLRNLMHSDFFLLFSI